MIKELKLLNENETWKLVVRPIYQRVLGSKWVYKLKRGLGGKVTRYKARWVIRGFE